MTPWLVVLWAGGAALTHVFGIWVAMGVTATCLAAIALFTEGHRVWGEGPHVRAMPAAIGAGLVMSAGTIVVFAPATTLAPWIVADVARLYDAFGQPGPVAAFVILPIVVTCEEVVWRGAVHDTLARRWPGLRAAAAGAVLYALAHAPMGSPALVLTCLGAGFCWAAVRVLTNSVPAAVLTHLVWDYAVLVAYPLVPPA